MADADRRLRGPRAWGLRARLTAALTAILAVAFGVTFVAVYEGTGSQVRLQIEHDLRQDTTDFTRSALTGGGDSPVQVERAARTYVAALPSFGAAAQLFVVQIPGSGVITNEPELIGLRKDVDDERESAATQALERTQAGALLAELHGFHTLSLRDVGKIRVLVTPVVRDGALVATATIGEPLSAVERAQHGVAKTFLLVGTLTLLAAIGAGYLLAARTARPLRRMARTAALVDAGDLAPRISAQGPRDEIRVLADAFDHMLDRLRDAFARQRVFVADASHELRTPLTVIRGQLEVLAAQPHVTRADVSRVEATVRTEIVRMQRLIDDLLLLARADDDQLLSPRPFELDPYLTALYESLTLLGERDFHFAPIPSGTLRADPDRLAQVLRNLVHNAVEHTDAGGRINVTAAVGGGRELSFIVDDDGPGIPADQRSAIFDRFTRTDTARARRAGGAGLGLAIARTLVAAHGGTIEAAESPLGGARVRFTVPGFAPGPGPEPGHRPAPAPPVATPAPPR
jgi:signal transduction histidine kinase